MGRLNRGEKVLIAAGVIGVPVFLAVAVTGGEDRAPKLPAASTASRPAQTTPSPNRAAASTPAGPSALPRPATDIDQPGDDHTPCVMRYAPTGDGHGTVLRITLTAAGDLIAHLNGPNGLTRHETQAGPGQLQFTDQILLQQVTEAGAILQETDGTRHVCAIHAAG